MLMREKSNFSQKTSSNLRKGPSDPGLQARVFRTCSRRSTVNLVTAGETEGQYGHQIDFKMILDNARNILD